MNKAIWQYSFEREYQEYWELLIKKAKRLRSLKEIDLFAIDEKEAKKINYQINQLSAELNQLIGFKDFAKNLEAAYSESISRLEKFYRSKSISTQIQNTCLKVIIKQQKFDIKKSIENEVFWMEAFFELLNEVLDKETGMEKFKNSKQWQ
ncbi:MAG: hypothetical protein R2879_21105 [Saprospiraceae bacterium]